MNHNKNILSYLQVFIFCLIVFVFASGSSIAQQTDWQDHQGYIQTRIISAPASMQYEGKTLLAWEAVLEPGWKTYWRSPGEAGLPVNLYGADGTQIDLMYPLPNRFELFGIQTFGYSKTVVIPFLADLSDKDQELRADFMICKDICIPFQTSYTVDGAIADQAGPVQQIKIDNWMDRVPLRGDHTAMGLEVLSVRVVGPAGRQKLIVDAGADVSLAEADMLVESVGGVNFTEPQIRPLGDGNRTRFIMDVMTGKNPVDLRSNWVRLTLTDGVGHAIDRMIDLTG